MERLKELRKEKKLSQTELANFMNVKQNTYSKWESGASEMNYETLKKISKFFNISIDYLLGLTEVKTQAEAEPLLKEVTFNQKEAIKKLLELNSNQLQLVRGYMAGLTIKPNSIYED